MHIERYYAPPRDLAALRPHFKESALLDLLARVRRLFTERSRLSRELIIFSLAFLGGLLLVPLAIWFVGNRMLGPYAHGTDAHAGPMALLGDFFIGLEHGAVTYWIVAVGPAVLILLVRGVIALLRYQPPPETRQR